MTGGARCFGDLQRRYEELVVSGEVERRGFVGEEMGNAVGNSGVGDLCEDRCERVDAAGAVKLEGVD